MQSLFSAFRLPLLLSRAAAGRKCEASLVVVERSRVRLCFETARSFTRTATAFKKRSTKKNRGEDRIHRQRNKHNINNDRNDTHNKRRDKSRERTHDQYATGNRRGRPRRETRDSIAIYVLEEPPSAESFNPKSLGFGWTTPSDPVSNHPTVSAVLKTGKLPKLQNFETNGTSKWY